MSHNTHSQLYDELHGWIQRGPIVETILAALWGEGLPLTKIQAKNLWYRVLEELPALLARRARSQHQAMPLLEKQRRTEPSAALPDALEETDTVPF